MSQKTHITKYNSYVYIVPLENKSAYKIGKSNKPSDRIMGLLKCHNFDMAEIFLYECSCEKEAFEIESIMHNIFSGQRIQVRGDGGTEFFGYESFQNANNIIDVIAQQRNLKKKRLYLAGVTDTNRIDIEAKTDILLAKIGNTLKKIRLSGNISQNELSDILKVGRSSIINIENGKNVSSHTLVKLLVSLNLENIFDDLFSAESCDRKRATKHSYEIINLE